MTDGSSHRVWLALRRACGGSDAVAAEIARRVGAIDRVFRSTEAELRELELSKDLARAVAGFSEWPDVDRELAAHAATGAVLVALDENDYPSLLRQIHDPPVVLAVHGAFDAKDERGVAMVGSRRASDYGLTVAERLGQELSEAGITVVSGLAVGIDGAGHRGALAAGGRTIAVLGSGLDRVYPPRHGGLAREIARRGAVVSEFAPGTPPLAHHFPRRNRIVAGLARAVIVVEANEKSGSLITARLALEEGRDVYAVPGEACLERSRGTHSLLRQGAMLIESARDVLEGTFRTLTPMGDGSRQRDAAIDGLDDEEKRLLDCFDGSTVPLDRLIAKSGLAASKVLEILLVLEVREIVRRRAGPAYSLAPHTSAKLTP